jgi:hypothetical protein
MAARIFFILLGLVTFMDFGFTLQWYLFSNKEGESVKEAVPRLLPTSTNKNKTHRTVCFIFICGGGGIETPSESGFESESTTRSSMFNFQ